MKTYKSSDVVGTEIYGLGNPDLKWQQTRNYNVSLDFSVLRNIVSARFEYYEKYTKNTLLDYSMAPSVGFSTMKENLGEISNKGYEVTLRLMPYSNPAKQAYWNIILNGARNKSKIEKISNALKVMKVTQEAHVGYKAVLWKIVKENGKTKKTQINSSTYQAVPRYVTKGAAEGTPATPAASAKPQTTKKATKEPKATAKPKKTAKPMATVKPQETAVPAAAEPTTEAQ